MHNARCTMSDGRRDLQAPCVVHCALRMRIAWLSLCIVHCIADSPYAVTPAPSNPSSSGAGNTARPSRASL